MSLPSFNVLVPVSPLFQPFLFNPHSLLSKIPFLQLSLHVLSLRGVLNFPGGSTPLTTATEAAIEVLDTPMCHHRQGATLQFHACLSDLAWSHRSLHSPDAMGFKPAPEICIPGKFNCLLCTFIYFFP